MHVGFDHRKGSLGNGGWLPKFGIANIWQANIWQNQKLPKVANFSRGGQEPIGSQPIESQILDLPTIGIKPISS